MTGVGCPFSGDFVASLLASCQLAAHAPPAHDDSWKVLFSFSVENSRFIPSVDRLLCTSCSTLCTLTILQGLGVWVGVGGETTTILYVFLIWGSFKHSYPYRPVRYTLWAGWWWFSKRCKVQKYVPFPAGISTALCALMVILNIPERVFVRFVTFLRFRPLR